MAKENKPVNTKEAKGEKVKKEKWELRLYIAGNTAKSAAALTNLKKYCELHLCDLYTLEVIDLLVHPQ